MPEIKNPFDEDDLIEARKDQEDPWILYLVVRESLNMSPGKVAAQVGHAVGMLYSYVINMWERGILLPEETEQLANIEAWHKESYRKIVLRADKNEWFKIQKELDYFVVRDAGLTQVEAGSETVMTFLPMKKSQAPKVIKRLQVLK